jgi:uncharacterized membrane protein YraQ (UPF0718 family)
MVDLGSLVLLAGAFGPRVALAYVLFGLLVAVIGGTIIEHLHMEEELEDLVRNAAAPAERAESSPSVRERLSYAGEQVSFTLRKVFPYLLLGVGVGALIHNWIPAGAVETVLGSRNPLGVVLASLIGVPMYADIFGTIPVAEALLAKGALLGTVISFMMAVTTLSLPSLILLRKAVKPKLLGVFILLCTLGIIAVGYVFNGIQAVLL